GRGAVPDAADERGVEASDLAGVRDDVMPAEVEPQGAGEDAEPLVTVDGPHVRPRPGGGPVLSARRILVAAGGEPQGRRSWVSAACRARSSAFQSPLQ